MHIYIYLSIYSFAYLSVILNSIALPVGLTLKKCHVCFDFCYHVSVSTVTGLVLTGNFLYFTG